MKTVDEAIEYAAKNLPSGAIVNIKIERHGYGVELEVFDEDGDSQIIGLSEESMIDDIITATDSVEEYK